jgi:hypothetical protein
MKLVGCVLPYAADGLHLCPAGTSDRNQRGSASRSFTLTNPFDILQAKIPARPDTNSNPATAYPDARVGKTPLLLGLFLLCFLAGATRAASKNPLWMDEVLAVWTARLPTCQAVWSALLHGSEASPPVYHLLLHALRNLLGDSYVVFRAPSILACFATALCLFTLLRRYLGTTAATYGMAFSLLGVLAWHGVEARPYSLVTTCFAVAVLLWDSLDWHQSVWGRIIVMAAMLALAISLHFYATLFVPCLGVMELLWSALNRRIRIPVWVGLILAGASTFFWLPFIRAHSRMIADETASIEFYGKPTLGRLVHAYSELMIFDKKQTLFLAATVFFLAAILVFGRRTMGNVRAPLNTMPYGASSNLCIIAASSVAFPFLVFAFALVVTKTFNLRYCLITALGFSCLVAYLASCVPAFTSAIAAILLAACPLTFFSNRSIADSLPEQVQVLKQAPGTIPIVVGEGRLYFELEEAVPPEMKFRLVYLESPAGVISPDPTNENHLGRWRRIRPDLMVVSAQAFFAQHPQFYLFHTPQSTDVITTWLRKRHQVGELIAQYGDASLYGIGTRR